MTTAPRFTASSITCGRCKRPAHPDEIIAPDDARALRICLRCVEGRRVESAQRAVDMATLTRKYVKPVPR